MVMAVGLFLKADVKWHLFCWKLSRISTDTKKILISKIGNKDKAAKVEWVRGGIHSAVVECGQI